MSSKVPDHGAARALQKRNWA